MESQRVDMYIATARDNFLPETIPLLRDRLLETDEAKFMSVQSADLKSPITALLFSIFLGVLGIDRFYIGDVGMGILKLLTLGGLGIIALTDLFLIQKRTRKANFEKITSLL